MKLFDFKIRDDWGKDYYFSLFKTKRYTVLQVSFSICETSAFPYFQLSMGMGKLFGFFCYAWRFGFDIDICGTTWWL